MSQLLMDQGLRAAREGRTVHRCRQALTVTGSFVVDTNAEMYYNIPAGKQVIITTIFVGCDTADEFAAGYLVGCSAIAGGGSPTGLSLEVHNHIGTKKDGAQHEMVQTIPPLIAKYSDGHRSVSLAVKATDTNTVVGYGWCGWVEDEGTLS